MKIFVSHATVNDSFVSELRERLATYGIDGWTDSRELTAGDALMPSIQKAIAEADFFVVILSFAAVNSSWVKKEIDYALSIKKSRNDGYKVIPLLKDGIKPSALALWFGEEPVAVTIDDEVGSLDRAMPNILATMGITLPMDPQPQIVKPEKPVADLIVTFTDPKIYQQEGKTRAQATVMLTYVPPHDASRRVESRRYRFIAPLGPIETGELTWYLENYFRWPTGVYQARAQLIEKQLPEWGKLLYDALHSKAATEAFAAWEGDNRGAERRLSVKVDREPPEGSPKKKQKTADEAATLLLSLPWELLHNGKEYLFEFEQNVRVRRQLPNYQKQKAYDLSLPLRVLLVSPRPEKDGVTYLDHRISARPLVEALAPLGTLAEWTFLSPPTFEALRAELHRANEADQPYHVVHFDGHGVYDPQHGLGALVFENHEDREVIRQRRSDLINAEQIADAVREYRVPLFFLEACQTALSEKDPTASVAGKLLEGGVASVVAMSHSVLVETAHRFVDAFYKEALQGERVGQAMLAGQRKLKADARRGHTFMGELRLQDWFVPVLYQEERDPQLVQEVPAQIVQEQAQKARTLRLGKLPETPPQTFVGRSRELLYAERMLHQYDYVVIVGEGGEGKTTLACELARWLVQTGRYSRAAFVSFEQATTADSALSVLGDQLVVDYQSKAGQGESRGWLEVERTLKEQSTLLVLDNLESVLKPPVGSPGEAAFEPTVLDDILKLCANLRGIGATRLLFTSREALPEPFHQNTLVLGRLSMTDAIELVAKTLGEGVGMPGTDTEQASREEIEQLVELVNGHARALVLIAREVARTKVQEVAAHLSHLLAGLEKQHPGERERSLLASVRLSLQRLPSEVREHIRPLGVFQGGVSLTAMRVALQIGEADAVVSLGHQLVEVGLAAWQEDTYLRFDPALTQALREEMAPQEQQQAREQWIRTMQGMAEFLYRQQFSNPQWALGVAAWELPNLLSALEQAVQEGGMSAEEAVGFATNIEDLAQKLGRVRALAQASRLRKQAGEGLGEWSNAAFNAESAAIERLLENGRFSEAVTASERLLQRCEEAGDDAYEGAAYNIAIAYLLLGRARSWSGAHTLALSALEEGERTFTLLGQAGDQDAARMAFAAVSERATCLRNLGRLEEAGNLYEQAIQEAQQRGIPRDVAVNRELLGTVRMSQHRYEEALQAYEEARKTYEQLHESQGVANVWHNMGMVYRLVGDYKAAERAYQEALQLKRLLNDRAGQANSLLELGNLYRAMQRHEEAVRFYQETADTYIQLGDLESEGRSHGNAAISLLVLRRYDEARRELFRALECFTPFGHSSEPWKAFNLLNNLERAVGNAEAAKEARQQAMQAYLDYRQDGGENTGQSRSLFETVIQALSTGQEEALAAQLTPLLTASNFPDNRKPMIRALLRILSGERGSDLAADPELDYMDAVELMLL